MSEEDQAVAAELRRKMPELAGKIDDEILAVFDGTLFGAVTRLAVAFKAFLSTFRERS